MARDVLEKAGALPHSVSQAASPQLGSSTGSASASTTAASTAPPILPEGAKPYKDEGAASSNITVVHPGKKD